ncbi:hypothetical protein OPV22_026276 [Ensete ventricosum]|uniref:Uncharacterized protein n=1 Tax=Ensete ventricosum TaxID=4639 RepID=A0A426YII0_ENSVE|nr:hypothetical protein OPV22_026276 [Ensete ventricosum]RRT51544.1 hypothetical protein B296_00047506 [Ensete ventricosum]RWW06394.1 hypothetical protein GW17_00030281 [Ensete ventricosum]RWW57445.1 hypothetical protein BHE74_00035773 [Ensete ventricosum]RZS10336.1 hypothetical protein BHM03_00041550 [Ensete ventricosum]
MSPSRPMSSLSILLLLLYCFGFCFSADGESLTAYEVLGSYGLPPGLLPKGALGYDLDASTGAFSAYLNGSCSFSLEGSYQLHYNPTISGHIASGRLSGLRGVSVKVLLFWVNIVEVRRLSDSLRFSVGIASADFAINNFFVSPRCGCGLNCPDDDDDDVAGFPLRLRRLHPGAVKNY